MDNDLESGRGEEQRTPDTVEKKIVSLTPLRSTLNKIGNTKKEMNSIT